MARVIGEVSEFTQDRRKVILLTMREGVALYNAIRHKADEESEDLQRARSVLFNQIEWLSNPAHQGRHH